jgi:L-arabinose isomerase
MNTCTIGLLPLYLKLYDKTSAEKRSRHEAFYKTISGELQKRGIRVIESDICREEEEFRSAVNKFEEGGAEAIVTLHLAYSPSLESAKVLSGTDLPLLVCDTSPTYSYSPEQDPDELFYNHGIHGVQDMCNLLIRNGKEFFIEAGHWEHSDVLDRIVERLKAVRMAVVMRSSKVGLIGTSFKGMGDFYTPPEKLKKTIGAQVLPMDKHTFNGYFNAVREDEMQQEMLMDRDRFICRDLDDTVHARSVRLQLAVKKWTEKEKLSAFTFNFLDITREAGFETVPFMAASKLMAEGIGYAGEGDVLTAAFIAALSEGDRLCSFSEMFSADWENDNVFLSHMGEVNYKLLDGKGMLAERDYIFSDVENPAVLSGRFMPGEFHIANLAPLPGDRYRLILAQALMLGVKGKDNMEGAVRGWFKPPIPVSDFLAEYSRLGGTHHLAVVYKPGRAALETFGKLMGWEISVIED